VARDRATVLRRQAVASAPATRDGRAGDELSLEIGMVDRLAREIAGHGADAVVLEPASLRDNVIERLRAQAGVN
jgi:proteasome accessory factor B